jgi:hypothetical protein
VLTEINSRLNNKEAKYLKTEQQSIKDMLAEPHEKKPNPCDDAPELQAMLQQLSHQHWVSWLDTSIPALKLATRCQSILNSAKSLGHKQI